MKTPLALTLALLLSGSSITLAETSAESAAVAWATRENPGQTERAVELWEKALAENPHETALYIPLTKAASRLYRHASAKKDKLHWVERARFYGEKAIQTNPNTGRAFAEYGVALGEYAEAHKGLSSLKLVKIALAMEQKASELDPALGFAHMVSAEIYRESPGRPLSIGDKTKALSEGLKAVDVAPNYPIHHLSLAKTYLALGQKAKAKEQLEKAIACSAPADGIPEAANDKEDAGQLLKTL